MKSHMGHITTVYMCTQIKSEGLKNKSSVEFSSGMHICWPSIPHSTQGNN